jgi:Fe-S-cluster containining protein
MCCDGTLFGYAELEEADDVTSITEAGQVVFVNGSQRGFPLPCPALVDRTCTVYDSRPSPCYEYKCSLLLGHEAGTISTVEAVEIIDRTMALRNRVRPALEAFVDAQLPLPFSGLHALMRSQLRADPDAAATTERNAQMIDDVTEVRALLAKHFDLPSFAGTRMP